MCRFSPLFVDISGPKRVQTLGKALYAAMVLDDAGRFTAPLLLLAKTDLVPALRRWYATAVVPTGLTVKYVLYDPGGEFRGQDFMGLLGEMGTADEETGTDTSQQNGVAERRMAVIDQGARASLYSAGLGDKLWLWGEAYNHATYILNRMCTDANQGASPYQRLYGVVDSILHVPPFGTQGYYRADPRRKLAPRGKACLMLG
ncbi:unnamed protein product, partial [Discosporangium mesarthrocarpum]